MTARLLESVSFTSRLLEARENWSRIAHGRREEYLLRRLLPIPTEEMLMKKNLVASACAALLGLAVVATGVRSQEKKESAAPPKIMHFGDLKWTPIIKGCDLAPVAGDPNAEGMPYVVRLRCVDGAKIPAHWHPTDENVTVLKGTFLAGMGETFDETKLTPMNAGNFVTMPKEMRHFAMSKGETIVQVHGAGPFKVNWVNPSEVQPPDAPPAAAAKPKS
jgi:anti-sigma factor ChrR (cupin superfamily)